MLRRGGLMPSYEDDRLRVLELGKDARRKDARGAAHSSCWRSVIAGAVGRPVSSEMCASRPDSEML